MSSQLEENTSTLSLEEPLSEKITIQSEDGVKIEVNKKYLMLSEIAKVMMEAEPTIENIKLFEEGIGIKSGTVLEKVVDFLNIACGEEPCEIVKPVKSKNMAENTKKEFADYVDGLVVSNGYPFLFEIIKASNYLQINFLTHLCCAKIAAEIKGKSLDEIKKTVDEMVKKQC